MVADGAIVGLAMGNHDQFQNQQQRHEPIRVGARGGHCKKIVIAREWRIQGRKVWEASSEVVIGSVSLGSLYMTPNRDGVRHHGLSQMGHEIYTDASC